METLPRRASTTTLGDLVERACARTRDELTALCDAAHGRGEAERASDLARWAHRARQRLARVQTLERWAVKSAKIASVAANARAMLTAHEETFARASDGLFHLHQQLEWARAPMWDLPGALEVMCHGNYGFLPLMIGEDGSGPGGGEDGDAREETEDERAAREDVETRFEEEIAERLIRSKAHGCEVRDDHMEWPSEKFKVFSIASGKAAVGVAGEYRATLTLGGPVAPDAIEQPRYGGWRVESIEILAGETDGKFTLNKAEERKLADIACASMVGMLPFGKQPEEGAPPLKPMHLTGLHRIASDAVLMKSANAIVVQAGRLKEIAERGGDDESRWSRNAIKVEIVKGEAAGVLKGLKVTFWRKSDGGAPGALDVSFNPEKAELLATAKAPGDEDADDVFINHECIDLEALVVNAIRIASSKKLNAIAEELASEKSFKTIMEESSTTDECACRDDEDKWGDDVRPSIRLEISRFTSIFITCRISDGTLMLHGANDLVPSATEAELSKRLALEGHSAISSIVEEVSVAVEQQELKGLLRASGASAHPAPSTMGGDPWAKSDVCSTGTVPTALVPVMPSDGGVFIATWMGATPTFALVRANRINQATRYVVDSIEKLDLGARKGAKPEIVVKLIEAACREKVVDAQRSALMRALKDLRLPFMDVRPTSKGVDKMKAEHVLSFVVANTARWARSKFKRAVRTKSSLKVHVSLRGTDGLSARIGNETCTYEHSEFAVNAVLADVRRIAVAQGFLSALEENDSAIDFSKFGCTLKRQDAYTVALSFKESLTFTIQWRHGGELGPGLYADGDQMTDSVRRALSVAARDGRCEIFACALHAVVAFSALAENLSGDFNLTFAEPNALSLVKFTDEGAMRIYSLGFRLDGSASLIIGRGGDAISDSQSADDDEMHITDDHESLLPACPTGLTVHIEGVASAVEPVVGSKLAHGDYASVPSASVQQVLSALSSAMK